MKKLLTTAEKTGKVYEAPSCEAMELIFGRSVMIGTSGVKEEEVEEW